MSEGDSKLNINSSGVKLNAAASEFVPGNYGSKPAASSATKAPAGGKPAPAGTGKPFAYNSNRPQNNNRNPGFNNMGGGMMGQQQFPAPPVPVDFAVQQYIGQMQQMAMMNGMMYDPVSNMMYMVSNAGYMPVMMAGMPPGMVPGMMLLPGQYATGGYMPAAGVPGEGAEGFEGAAEGQVADAQTADASAPAETPAVEEPAAATAAAPAAAPAPAPASTGKYVPPTRSTAESAPAPAAAPAAAVQEVAAKLSGLTIETEDAPVDIEAASPGRHQRYSKNDILRLYSSEGVVIPLELKDFFKAADYAAGSVDGTSYCRAPLPSISALAEGGAAFGGRDTPGSRGKGSSNNLRHSQSGNNLERSASSSSFGNARHEGGNNRRKGGNRDADKDREPGEIVEGDEGFVAAPEGEEGGVPRERVSRRAKVPAVYKSRFALDASDPMAIVRKANAILNKMSVTNFEKLSDEFLALLQADAVTEESLQKSVEAMVTKAQMEENFCFIYADLCRKVIDTWTQLEPEDGNFTPAPGASEEAAAEATAEGAEGAAKKAAELRPMGKIFRECLLSRCQAEFEFDHIAALKEIRENAELAPDERTEKEILLKKRTTGHMRFIGELYMKDLITASIMKGACLEVLLKSEKEEELVCLCKLFQTVGAKLEKYHLDRSKQKKYKAQNMQDVFPAYFEQITVIGNAHPSSRVRFMMKDLVEMRSNDWTARREEDKMINLDKKNAAADFAPVQTAYVSGDARQNDAFAAAPVDEWSVVPAGGNKKRPPTSGAPSPVPGGNISRTNSNAQISRSNSTSNNLGSQDRRGPRAPGPSGPAIAAPLKKEKSAGKPEGSRGPARDASKQPRGPRGSSASPVPNGDKEDESDAAETAAAPAEAASYGTDLGEIQKRVRSAMKEFYANGLLEEPTLTFQELRPSPELMSDIVKDMISQAVETSSEKSCSALCNLLDALRSVQVPGLPAPLLAAEDVKEAVYKFLNNFDDVLIDAPKAGTLGAVIVASLCDKGVLALDLFGTLPEVNEFAFSAKFVEFVVQVVAALKDVSGPERAEEAFRASQLQLLPSVLAPPKEEPADVLKALAAKYGVAFVA